MKASGHILSALAASLLSLMLGCASTGVASTGDESGSPSGAPPPEASAETNTVAAVAQTTEPSSSTPVQETAGNQAPLLSPGFLVQVSVLVAGKKEIDEPAKRVSDSGALSLPLVGSVPATGLSLQQLSERLTVLYSDFFVQPQVVVEFVQDGDSDMVSPWGYVTVLGKVKNPGRVSLPPTQDMTVSGAIQKAGGFDTSAKDSAIRVTRQLPNGRTERFDVNLRRVGVRGRARDDLILKPGDVVFVPEMIF